MAHKTERADIFDAFNRYKERTGDTTAILENQGAYWRVRGRYPELEGYGKEQIVTVLDRFCDGWDGGYLAGEAHGFSALEEHLGKCGT